MGLGVRRPETRARPLAVAETGAVEQNDTVSPGQAIDKAAHLELLDQGAIAVDEDHRVAFADVPVAKPHAVHGDEAADGRMLLLGSPGPRGRVESERTERRRARCERRHEEAALVARHHLASHGSLLWRSLR